MNRTRDFTQVVRRQLAADPDLAAAVEQEAFNADIAIQIYNARTAAGLTQKQLADRIGSHLCVIARLEDADYEGHSLSMLRRIGDALNCQVRVEFYRRVEEQTIAYDAGITFEGQIQWEPAEKTEFDMQAVITRQQGVA